VTRAESTLLVAESAAKSKRIAELEATLAKAEATLAQVSAERDKLRRAYEQLKVHYELLKRRIFVATAERVDTAQLELEFAETKAKLEALATALGKDLEPSPEDDVEDAAASNGEPERKKKKRTGGRPKLSELDMPEERVELLDAALEGKAERIDFEETCLLGYRKATHVRIVVARAKYKVEGPAGAELVVADKPKELYERGMLAPSMIAHVLVKKFRFGMPFHRLVEELRSYGIDVSDSTMCRYAEHIGASLGPIVDACAREAKETAFCLSTDATGVAIQPEPIPGKRQSCAKGHFFVVLADKDHVFFEYQKKHSSAAVCEMFRGFGGYIQADAHCVYDALFRGDAKTSPEDPSPTEIGCWSHARRKFWEAAVGMHDEDAREAMMRISEWFDFEEGWASFAPKKRHELRQRFTRPRVDAFFAWAEGVNARVRGVRGPVATAFGYALRHREALTRFLDDGRLRLENNASERALRRIAVGRNAWLFFGSDDHAGAAANLFSLIASCQLHGIEAEDYLAEVIRVMPYWPPARYLELAPKYWRRTRARLVAKELDEPIGHITVPPPPSGAEQ
jgi:transposase